MGHARNASAGDNKRSWRDLFPTKRGEPVPFTGKRLRRQHRGRTGSNKSGTLHGTIPYASANENKRYDSQHNVNNSARQQVIAAEVAGLLDSDSLDPDFYDPWEDAGLEAWYDGDIGPNILLNGESPDLDYDDWCGE